MKVFQERGAGNLGKKAFKGVVVGQVGEDLEESKGKVYGNLALLHRLVGSFS